ncbi:MAG: response regulator [Oryzomonas sp.]|uniref:response regulator n=1 Tax=Oryzomonas sp. TaxID=2855186 RepID=UPI0028455496|nr:response regulator [Oryzomonas sp.]MDR3579561.1 response regulator [Oryzomonas sp.]
MKYLDKTRILCVDDERNVLRSLERIFIDDDYEILTASSAEEGLRMLENNGPFQVVISDYRMPAMDGVEFLKEVYRRWPDTVRIVLSGYADTAAIVSAINEGRIYKFIPKPWNDHELRVTVANAVERYALQKSNRELMVELSRANDELEQKVKQRTFELELRNHALTFSQCMLDALPVAVVGVDIDGMVVQGSRRAAEIFNTVEGGFFGSDRRATLPDEFNRIIDTLEEEQMAYLDWTHGGTDYDVRCTKFRCFDQPGIAIVLIEKMS